MSVARWRIVLVAVALLAAGCRSTPSGPEPAPLDVQLAGQTSFDVERLEQIARDEVARAEEARPSKASIDDAAFALELFYRSEGFADARVHYAYDDVVGASVRARFTVEEGALHRVETLVFSGAETLADDVLKSFFGAATERGVFVRTEIESSARALRDHYNDLGFRRARVDATVRVEGAQESGERPVFVDVAIDEGVHWRIVDVALSGALEALAAEQRELVAPYVGRPYVPRLAFEMRSLILSEYAHRGYPDAVVTTDSQIDEETGEVRVALEITPGPLVVIRSLQIEGNDRTRASVVRDRIAIRGGKRFDEESVRAGTRELYSTGLFESVRVALAPVPDDASTERPLETGEALRDLVVTVVETPAREVRLEPGYGSYEGPRIVAAIEDRNALGRAYRLSLSAHVSELAMGSRLALANTRLFGYPLALSVSLFTEQREEPSFEVERIGTDAVLRRKLSAHVTGSLGYEYRVSDLIDIDGVITSAEEVDEPNVGAVTTSLTYDDRDNVLLPTRGIRARAQAELADAVFGSELDAFSMKFDVSRLFFLGEGITLATTARTGFISPIGDTEIVPIHERMFNGGENSVRSFKEDELGPKDTLDEPTGGEAFSFLSVEYRQRLVGNFGYALFADAGNVQPLVGDYFEYDDFRFGVGIGLRYSLPIGPVRLDLGVNPNPRDGEDDFVLHFSVGFPY